ncbi:pentapeptide repeat-containing protein [Marinobacter panjinensis]|uniref:Pentapeptide repeat-containing protein n=1 Tax=Marinobacter panjinensis TaxID=2576384 RepID=A0A4U6R797_9GAMM|nr:pentapeptide repeat-containing protein [Marinobacter panjinensis]MCR8914370.1 pentapeptide repeat-containing protein [Marinobacter panjinensis]TKV68792.1 pentapeptide repeat-containing protein [Marinobacter panjinensis]
MGQDDTALRVKALHELEDLAVAHPGLVVPTIDQLALALRNWRALSVHPMYLDAGFDVPNDTGLLVVAPPLLLEPLEMESQLAIDILGRLLEDARVPVNLSDLNFDRAKAHGGTFRDVDFSRCSLVCAEFSGAVLDGAEMSGTNILHATGLTAESLKTAHNTEHACALLLSDTD